MSAISVAVIDSGAGGLTVANEIHIKLPNLRIHYVADHDGFPYGPLSAEQIFDRLSNITSAIITRYDPSIVVIACNSASTLVLDRLRARFQVPFVGVVPAIKPAASLSTSGHIAVLATKATCESAYLKQLIADFAQDKVLHTIPSTALVQEAEKSLLAPDTSPNSKAVEAKPCIPNSIIEALKRAPQTDTVVLACTHFPLLKGLLATEFPHIRHWVDSGEAIARRVEDLLNKQNQSTNAKQSAQSSPNTFNFTGAQPCHYHPSAIAERLGAFEQHRLDLP